MSSMLSAPAVIPATRHPIFTGAFTPHGRAIPNPVRGLLPAAATAAAGLRSIAFPTDNARLPCQVS
jgi:hypothetical protein